LLGTCGTAITEDRALGVVGLVLQASGRAARRPRSDGLAVLVDSR
jgi:hypothetical protein